MKRSLFVPFFQKLERNEWRDLRKDLKKDKSYPRKCRRRFLRYCDANDDKGLDAREWRECLGLNRKFQLPSDIHLGFNHSKEKNRHICFKALFNFKVFTPPQNRGGVIFSLQFVCVSVCLSLWVWVRLFACEQIPAEQMHRFRRGFR